jgi:dihydrofolate synthase/folylpolyglutamate synthase
MTIEDALAFIHSSDWKGSRLGLERMRALMRLLGDPQETLKFIHVAGTNGKGSVCAMLSAILEASGRKTGMYTSPHLFKVNERMRINGTDISNKELAKAAERVKAAAELLEDQPTEFEIITAMAFCHFEEHKCDVVVLETGLGGRLDATNVIPVPEVAAICSIGLDHTEVLGGTLEEIAGEKAGIIKKGCAVVACSGCSETEHVFWRVCKERQATLRKARFGDLRILSQTLDGQRIDWGPYQSLAISLLGEHQARNAVMALETVEELRDQGWSIDEVAVRYGLAHAQWPARLEALNRDPLFLLDGAHNPQCVEMLAKSLPAFLKGEPAVFLTGVLAEKDYPQMMAQVAQFAKAFACLAPESRRALSAGELAEYLKKQGAKAVACECVPQGIETALALAEGGPVVAFGSLYLAGALREAYRNGNWCGKGIYSPGCRLDLLWGCRRKAVAHSRDSCQVPVP